MPTADAPRPDGSAVDVERALTVAQRPARATREHGLDLGDDGERDLGGPPGADVEPRGRVEPPQVRPAGEGPALAQVVEEEAGPRAGAEETHVGRAGREHGGDELDVAGVVVRHHDGSGARIQGRYGLVLPQEADPPAQCLRQRHQRGGFALVAWPVHYGASGIMTFLVNQDGVVYHSDQAHHSVPKAARCKATNASTSASPVTDRMEKPGGSCGSGIGVLSARMKRSVRTACG